MKLHRLSLLCFLIITPSLLHSQMIITGGVYDAQTGKTLPSANIHIVGTLRGAIANADGNYQLHLQKTPAEISVSYIGYETRKLLIDTNSPGRMDISLTPSLIDLGQYTITAENPAIAIMRKVIAKKTEMRKKMSSFRTDAYSRLNVQNDTAIVMIMESQSQVFWKAGEGTREVMVSRQQSANLENIPATIGANDIPNFYDDNINIIGYSFIGPTHPNAFAYYDFQLMERRAMDGKIVFDISLQPKSKLQPTFTGEISVLDQEFVILEVDLYDNAVLPPLPFMQSIQVHCQQQFRNFDTSGWLPADWHETGKLRIGMTGLQFPTIKYVRLSSLDNYEINIALPDTLFEKGKKHRTDVKAATSDSQLTFINRAVPLTLDEKFAYKTIDSTRTIDRYFKPSGFLAKFAKISVRVEDEEIANQSGQSTKKSLKPVPLIWFNRADGFHLGLRTSSKMAGLSVSPQTAFNLASKQWAYGVTLSYDIKKWAAIELKYLNGSQAIAPSALFPQMLTSIPILFSARDYYDYFWKKGFEAHLSFHSQKKQLDIKIGVLTEKQSSLTKKTDFDLVREKTPQRENPAIIDGELTAFKGILRWGDNEATAIGGQKGITIEFEQGIKPLGSDFSYSRGRLIFNWHTATFLRRRPIPAALDVRLAAGGHLKDLPPQQLMAQDGSLSIYSPFGSFRTLRDRPVYSGQYAALFWEHSFRTWPFEVIGLRFLVKNGWSVILHGAHGKSWDKSISYDGFAIGFPDKDHIHHEIGLSLSGLFSYLRLDVSKKLTGSRAVYFGVSLAKIF